LHETLRFRECCCDESIEGLWSALLSAHLHLERARRAFAKGAKNRKGASFLLLGYVIPKALLNDSGEDGPYLTADPCGSERRADKVPDVCLAVLNPTGGDRPAVELFEAVRFFQIVRLDIAKGWFR
jgi:hypothetical protein